MSRVLEGAVLSCLALITGCGDKDDPAPADTGVALVEDADGDGVSTADGDCDDNDPEIHPSKREICDGIDQDCDGEVDEEAWDAPVWYRDADDDGFGEEAARMEACEQPEGWSAVAGDCDDTDDDVHPDAQEVCDGFEVDEDCDGLINSEDDSALFDDATPRWYRDDDGDGYGDVEDTEGRRFCEDPGSGWAEEDQTDCDDSRSYVNPGESERCWDAVDNDCDGESGCTAGSVWTSDEAGVLLYGSALATGAQVGSVVAVGDVDGDGVDEALSASAAASSGAGRVWWVDTLPAQETVLQAVADAVSASGAVDQLGSALVVVPDLDGDGFDELLVGAAAEDARSGGAGAAWLFLGPLSGDLDDVDADVVFVGSVGGDLLGQSLAGGGELTGDGTADLVLGAPGGGSTYILSGLLSGEVGMDSAAATLSQPGGGAYSGPALVADSDVDGDGVHDLILGYPHATESAGQVLVFLGPVSGELDGVDAERTLSGGEGGDHAGWSLATSSDLDGDGVDDLMVGAPEAETGGHAYLLSGSSSASGALEDLAFAQLHGPADGYQVGETLDLPGDLDGDFVDDLVVGAPAGFGLVYVHLGPLTGGVRSVDQGAAAVFVADTSDDQLGSSLASGDLDGDGTVDLLLGAPLHGGESGVGKVGAVLVLLGPGLE